MSDVFVDDVLRKITSQMTATTPGKSVAKVNYCNKKKKNDLALTLLFEE
jgi:hypothetical protein